MVTMETRGGDPHPRPVLAYLALTALLCGALVMVIEVLGSRVIGPFFGVSLFVWTALITVTLVALAAGYAAGGHLADRNGSPDRLFAIIIAAGVLVLLIPLARGPVLKAAVPLGLRAGALASAAVLFGPALLLLGCVSPFLVRIAAREWARIGRTVGILYALSTVGSFLGTVLTGYVLIARYGVGRIFAGTGLLLILLGAGWFAFFRRRRAVLALLALPLPLLLRAEGGPLEKVLPGGTRVSRLLSRDGFYGNLKVVEYSGGGNSSREMVIDGLIQSALDPRTGLSIYEYPYFLQFLPWGINPGGKTCLVLGLGPGIVPTWYAARGVRTDVVEIDPAVVETAQRWFGFRPSGRVAIDDARYFLATSRERYDYVVIDIYNGDTTPGHVLSLEALRLAKERLAAGGVLAMNLMGSLRTETLMTASVVRTLEEIFDQVEVRPTFDPDGGDGSGNLAVIAYDGPPRSLRVDLVGGFPVHPLAREGVTRFLDRKFRFAPGTPAMVLTDDFNPIDVRERRLKERVRRDILQTTDWDILL